MAGERKQRRASSPGSVSTPTFAIVFDFKSLEEADNFCYNSNRCFVGTVQLSLLDDTAEVAQPVEQGLRKLQAESSNLSLGLVVGYPKAWLVIPMVVSYLRLLKKRSFFLLWFGQIISQFGDRLTQMALIGLVYRIQPGSPFGLAKMLSLAILPVFLISPVAGVYVDRWNKQKTMYLSDFLRGVFILLVPLVLARMHALLLIYLLIFLSFCVGRFFIPAKMALIPSLVSKEEFFLANSLVSITAMIAAVLGFGIGGVIVERWGVKSAFFLDAATFLLSAIFIFLMRIKEKAVFSPRDIIELGKDAFKNVKNSFLVEAKEGFRYLLRSKETRYAAKVFFALFASIGSLYTVFIVFIQNSLLTVTADLGWLAVGIGGGLFLGSLLYGRIGAELPVKKMVSLCMAVISLYLGFFVIFLRTHPYKIFAFASCFLLGVLSSPIVIAVNTLIHKESKDNFWGRIFSSLEIVIHLAFFVFMFFASYLAEKFTPFVIIVSVCALMFTAALFSFLGEDGKD